MSFLLFVLLILLGFLIGIPSGMFGFGGSSISTPLLRILFNFPPYIALASPLPMTLVSSVIATKIYRERGLVDWGYVFKISSGLIPGSIIGAYLTKFTGGKLLMYLTAGLIMYIALRFLLKHREVISGHANRSIAFICIVGLFIGFLSGMLANGGGIFVVPALVYVGLNLKKSIGTSMAIVLMGVFPSIVVHTLLGHIDWLLTFSLSLGVLPGSFLGSRITVKIKSEQLGRIYGLFLIIFAVYFLFFEIFS